MIDTKLLKDIVTVSDMLGKSDRDFVNFVYNNTRRQCTVK